MRNSKVILDRLVDELGHALELDRGSDSAFKAQVYQGLLRAQQAMGTCSVDLNPVGSRDRQQLDATLISQRAENPLDDDELIAAHIQLRQIFRNVSQHRQCRPHKIQA